MNHQHFSQVFVSLQVYSACELVLIIIVSYIIY
jgi:hypothetical protein